MSASNPPQYHDEGAQLLSEASRLFREKNFVESLKTFAKLECLPEYAGEACYGAGLACLELSDFERAWRYFTKCFEIDPTYVNALYQLGVIEEGWGELEAAKRRYEQALTLAPDHKSAAYRLMQLNARENEPAPPSEPRGPEPEPFESAATSSSFDPNEGEEDPEGLRSRAFSLFADGNLQVSKSLFEKLAKFPDYGGEGAYGLGIIALSRGNLHEARAHFAQCIPNDQSYCNALYQLGVVAERSGLEKEAEAWFTKTLAFAPDHMSARASLKALHPGFYGFLAADSSTISRKTVALIDELEREVRPRFLSYVGRSTAFCVLVLGLTVTLYGAPLALALLLFVYVRVLTTHFYLVKGRLRVNRGVFHKREPTFDIWHIQSVSIDRTIINRLTGDGTMVFELTRPVVGLRRSSFQTKGALRRAHIIKITGLARGAELGEMRTKLIDLQYLIRANPATKGLIV